MSVAADRVRVEIAVAVAAVLTGRSLKAVLAPAEQRIADARDRALLHAVVLATVRGVFRWRAILRQLLDRPLPSRARPVEAALMAALAQMDALGMPPHAVVDETVAAVRAMKQPAYAGLANAVLRRWLRERETIAAIIADDPEVQQGHPAWLLDRLRKDWPEAWPSIVAAGNAVAPMWLRVNSRRLSTEEYRQRLSAAGIAAHRHPELSQALRLDAPVPVARLPGFTDGLVSVQDAAAQYAVGLLAAEPGHRVLDACAAPGGKTAHLLERTPALADVVALDREPARLARIAQTLERLDLRATLREGDAGEPGAWWDGRPFDRILLDAPCSATGILRRQPDVRLHRRPGDIASLAAQQSRLLQALWPLLAPGGRLLYAVCSVLREESEAVIDAFAAGRDDVRLPPLALAGAKAMAAGMQILPGTDGMDGFAYAALVKI